MDSSWTLNEIKQYIKVNGYTTELIQLLQNDPRRSAEKLLKSYHRDVDKSRKQREAYEEKLHYENRLIADGCTLIAGIDEAGRGPLAGPVVAAAVILPVDFYLADLNDSKQLAAVKRESYSEVIKTEAVSFGIGVVDSIEIDQLNIFQAAKKAMYQAVEKLDIKPEHVLVDAIELEKLPYPQTSIIKGDQKSVSIAAASILAKVTRDKWMREAAVEYPLYGFDKNMGYGTKAHLDGLKKYGPSPCHRYSFSPVAESLRK